VQQDPRTGTPTSSKPSTLNEHDPVTFENYLHCIRHNAVPGPSSRMPDWPSYDQRNSDYKQFWADKRFFVQSRYDELAQLCVLADELLDATTTNLAIDEIRGFYQSSQCCPSRQLVDFVWNSTENDDSLRVLLADFFADTAGWPHCTLPKDLFALIVKRLRVGGNVRWLNIKGTQNARTIRRVR